MGGKKTTPEPACPYPKFLRGGVSTARIVSLHQKTITALPLKRNQLQHGRLPGELTALVPTYLKRLPRDRVDGKPLRYRLQADGSFVLYSIGADAKDDGGDSRPPDFKESNQNDAFGSGRDWVWPV